MAQVEIESRGGDLEGVSIEGRESVVAQLDFDTGAVQLPLDQFSADAPEFTSRMTAAMETLVQRCLVERGFPGPVTIESKVSEEGRTFGAWSVSKAAAFGFAGEPERTAEDAVPRGAGYDEAFGSCLDDMRNSLRSEFSYTDAANIDRQISTAAYGLTVQSAAGKQAYEDRALCAESKGIVMDPDRISASVQYYEEAPDMQIRTATAFAECSVSTGAVQTLFDLMARYQTAMIERSAGALSEHQKKLAEISARFDAIISGAEVPE
ncbi:hypothetical protein [Mycetocola tolaasinivorans]|nr:hypothetical protein [Mycetocola tolaasinivorans]